MIVFNFASIVFKIFNNLFASIVLPLSLLTFFTTLKTCFPSMFRNTPIKTINRVKIFIFSAIICRQPKLIDKNLCSMKNSKVQLQMEQRTDRASTQFSDLLSADVLRFQSHRVNYLNFYIVWLTGKWNIYFTSDYFERLVTSERISRDDINYGHFSFIEAFTEDIFVASNF